MKLYDFALAPNPRRVRMFLAEKGIEVPTEQINTREAQQFSDEFQKINPRGTVPRAGSRQWDCHHRVSIHLSLFRRATPRTLTFWQQCRRESRD